MELAGDQWRPVVEAEEEEVVEDLQRPPRQSTNNTLLDSPRKGEDGDGGQSENNIYLNKNGGALEDLEFTKILNASIFGGQKDDSKKAKNESFERKDDNGESSQIIEEEIEEEVVELEFEKAIPKLKTHTMHCPNCDAHITKVVLRRKIIKKTPQVIEKSHEPVDLLGCLSCFSLFVPRGGRFNPFYIFENNSNPSEVPQLNGKVKFREQGNCLSMFRIFEKGGSDVKTEDPSRRDPEHVDPAQPGKDESHKPDYGFNTDDFTPHHPPREDESLIDVPSEPHSEQEARPYRRQRDSTNFEIMKSIVYGGLLEIIASLSVVASAVASDATALNIIALALANLVGGILIIGHNVWDLRNDCYKRGLNQESRNKYKDLLGTVDHFPFHLIIVILSFVAFGVVPPVAYGLSFRQTHDKDFTMLVVAIASLLCVGLLAIFKAYVTRSQGFLAYLRIVVYYVTTAISVSGLSYVVGHFVMRFIEEFGLLGCHSTLTSTRPSSSWHHTDLVRGLGNDMFSSF